MKFKHTDHSTDLYNILLNLSRNIFFYREIQLIDNFETRVYLMFFHFSIMMLIFKKKGKKFSQKKYDTLFNKIEYNLRESGYGDVTVNKKMKELNKILYDILLKIDKKNNHSKDFQLNLSLLGSYFKINLNNDNNTNLPNKKMNKLNNYFDFFYNFCFELSLDNMIREVLKFKY